MERQQREKRGYRILSHDLMVVLTKRQGHTPQSNGNKSKNKQMGPN